MDVYNSSMSSLVNSDELVVLCRLRLPFVDVDIIAITTLEFNNTVLELFSIS